jgi:hypothetical protein
MQALRRDTRRALSEAREIREGMQGLRQETRRAIGEARELREGMREILVFEDLSCSEHDSASSLVSDFVYYDEDGL